MDKQLAEKLGQVARAARLRAGLTQADVAERLGIATEVYGRLERGLMLPSVETLTGLCKVLGVPADHLLGLGSGEPPPSVPHHREGELRPEVRRLLRRVERLDRRKLRLLNMLAAELARGKKTP